MTSDNHDYQQRFGGIARLYGENALRHLSIAHFAVIGIGGVGSWVAEALARSGVGEITLVDMDDVCVTNTNRQIQALNTTIGLPKIEVMSERLRQINPQIIVHCVDDFLETDNIRDIILPEIHVVIDAIDAAYVKAALISHCKRQKQQIITVGSAGGKRDPRLVTSGDLARTVNDPLLAKTRNNLRRLHNFSRNPKRVFSVESIYSTEQMVYPDHSGGICQTKSQLEDGVRLDCAGGFGSITMVTSTFAMVATHRALERYLSRAPSTAG